MGGGAIISNMFTKEGRLIEGQLLFKEIRDERVELSLQLFPAAWGSLKRREAAVFAG